MASRSVLLTGAAGVIGTALIPHLRGQDLVCMTRATPLDAAEPAESITADVTEPGFGLPVEDYRALAKRVDLVVHAAAVTDWGAPVEHIRRANVDGTRTVLEFCTDAGADLVHIGTAFVTALRPTAPLELPADNTIVNYVRSKVDADALVAASGVPATTVRPSNLVGDTVHGRMVSNQIIQLVSDFVLRGKVPYVPARLDAQLDFLPQDTVAAATAAIVLDGETGGDHWLTAGTESLPLADALATLLAVAAERGRPIAPPEPIDPATSADLVAALPRVQRAFFERLTHFVDGVVACGTFPTDLPALRERYDLPYLPPAAAFRRGLQA